MKLRILSDIPLTRWEEKLSAMLFLEPEYRRGLQVLGSTERRRIVSVLAFLSQLDEIAARRLCLDALAR